MISGPRKIVVAVAIALGVGLGLANGGALAQGNWQAGGGEKWRQVMEAAKKEGKVVVAGQPALADPFTKNFKRDTGIELEFMAGNTRELSARFNNEARAGNLTIDAILSGGAQFPLMESGHLVALKPLLILPGSADGPHYPDGKAKWMDAAGTYMFQGANYLFSYPLFNSDVIKPGTVKNWKDLLKPEFKGKIAVYDPRSGGPGQAVAAYLADVFGIDFVKQLYVGQDVKYTRDGRQLVEWVARGVNAIALGASQADVETFRKQGIKNLQVLSMEDGPGSVVGGFSVLKIAKGAPHPNAATVFLNWYASQPGQQTYTDAMEEPSRRKDVKIDDLPSYIIPKPGVKYVDQYHENWYLRVRPKVEKDVVNALGGR
jgi:ABC-type Fe3+ transport system substrate-binding protein